MGRAAFLEDEVGGREQLDRVWQARRRKSGAIFLVLVSFSSCSSSSERGNWIKKESKGLQHSLLLLAANSCFFDSRDFFDPFLLFLLPQPPLCFPPRSSRRNAVLLYYEPLSRALGRCGDAAPLRPLTIPTAQGALLLASCHILTDDEFPQPPAQSVSQAVSLTPLHSLPPPSDVCPNFPRRDLGRDRRDGRSIPSPSKGRQQG